MSEAPATLLKEPPPADLPLSVLLFYTAMCQKVALSEFAKQLGIGPLSLRQFISGQAQRPRGRTLELLAKALGMSVEEVRRRTNMRLASAPRFNDWIKEKMDGRFSRARLTRETGISDGALRNYLSGQTLPDSNQAQRLAETLDADSLEMAKVLVADHIVRNGGQTLPPSATDGMPYSSGAVSPSNSGAGGEVSSSAQRSLLATQGAISAGGEEQLLMLWRKLHPQGRRATLNYIAALLAEE
jgi:transcriptional regulator with XRE-family HTH domain